MRVVSTPKPWFAASASPESLSRTRLKAGVVVIGSVPGFPLTTSSILLCDSKQSLCHPERSEGPMQFRRRPRLHGPFASLRMTGKWNLNRNKKGAPAGRPELFAFRLCRLRNSNSLAHVTHLEAGKPPYCDVLAQLADLGGDQLRDRNGLVLDEGLLQQADFFIELLHLTV